MTRENNVEFKCQHPQLSFTETRPHSELSSWHRAGLGLSGTMC